MSTLELFLIVLLSIGAIGMVGWHYIGEPASKPAPYDPKAPEYKAPEVAPNFRSNEPIYTGDRHWSYEVKSPNGSEPMFKSRM
tara:strand:- start:951 stop:1199 length:249 start_codon:yes stop_codon:yes gene_type:complete